MRALLRLCDALRHRGRERRWAADLATGRRGEDLAHRFLQQQGYIVVARNYRTRGGSGEVDLIAWEGDTLVFVEVKTRRSDEFGSPERAVDHDKRRKLIRAAGDYVRKAGTPWERVRFDVISVVLSAPPAITHIRDAFRPRPALY
ncbi:MAG: YraN family protein [Bryobacterales bacterium]|nr:YraN family protein [Bryobacteraceae bacterium]MDW8353090.1 YraN family protein [Bryobacterales bacterium]